MRLSHSTWGMPTVPIDVAVAHCAALGFDGLEMTVIPGWTTDAAGLDCRRAAAHPQRSTTTTGWSCAGSPATRRCWSRCETDACQRTWRDCAAISDLAAELQHPGERLTVSTTSGGDPDDWEASKGTLVDRFGELAAVRAARRGRWSAWNRTSAPRCTVPSRRSGSWSRSIHPV